MTNIKSALSNAWSKVKPYVYGLIWLLVVFGCLFLIYAAATGLWSSLGETVQQLVAGGIAIYIAISVLGCLGSVLLILGVVVGLPLLYSWIYNKL